MHPHLQTTVYVRHVKFFRGRLLIQDTEKIVSLIERMEKEAKGIKAEILRICWSMRGGLTYSEAMNLSFSDREQIASLIKENLDTTKKTGLQYF